MKVYIADSVRESADAEELEHIFEEEEGEDLVLSVMEWKGRMTVDYASTDLGMDQLEAKEILESLEDKGLCTSREF